MNFYHEQFLNFYHQQFLGLSVPKGNPWIRSVRQGIKRAHIGMGSQQEVRRLLTRGMLTKMQKSVQAWGGKRAGVMDWSGANILFHVASVGTICQRTRGVPQSILF